MYVVLITLTGGLCNELDLILVLDYSGSISFVQGWNDMRAFSQQLIAELSLSPDIRISIATFWEKAQRIVS